MKILLVEDLPEMRAVTHELLESLGHQVRAMATAREALLTLASGPSAFDALITDIQLPGASGTDLLIHELSRGTDMALLAFSGSNCDEVLAKLVRQGRVSFLRKPFGRDDLAHRLEEAVLARRRPFEDPRSLSRRNS